jgi:hypothetical protein
MRDLATVEAVSIPEGLQSGRFPQGYRAGLSRMSIPPVRQTVAFTRQGWRISIPEHPSVNIRMAVVPIFMTFENEFGWPRSTVAAIGRRGTQPLQIVRRKKGCSMVWNRFMGMAGLDPGQVRYCLPNGSERLLPWTVGRQW